MSAVRDRATGDGSAESALRRLSERSRANFGRTRAIVRARLGRRRTSPIPETWLLPFGIWLLALLIAALLLDPPVGAFFGKWNQGLAWAAEYSTRLALGMTYILPACMVLVWANLTDWGSWRGRRLLALYNRTVLAGFVLATVVTSGLLANVLKYGIGRGRPLFFAEHGAYHFEPFAMTSVLAGFPSGHATTTGAMAALLFLLFPKWRYAIAPVAAWLACTRTVLNAHYPSDIVAGLGLGAAVTFTTALLFARLGYLFEVDENGRLTARKTALILR